MFILTVATLSSLILVISGHPQTAVSNKNSKAVVDSLHLNKAQQSLLPSLQNASRTKRTTEHYITDCIHMTSEEGEFHHEAASATETACGVYLFAEPDQRIEIHFNYVDVPCENGGLVAFVDGWELNGEFFPNPMDHLLPMQSRFSEFCGKRKIKQVFLSSQNVALIQYRMPSRGSRFSFSVRFVKNPTPCNILLQSTEDIYTLRNYGKRINCSISALFPAAVRVVALSVGVVPSSGRGIEVETGTLHKCEKRGLHDFVQIGGSSGLDNTNLLLADSVCGIDSKPAKQADLIGCGTISMRMISSGAFDNFITLSIRQLNEEDITDGYLSVICPPEDILQSNFQ